MNPEQYFNRRLYTTGDNLGKLGIERVVKMAVLKLKGDKKAAKTSFLEVKFARSLVVSEVHPSLALPVPIKHLHLSIN